MDALIFHLLLSTADVGGMVFIKVLKPADYTFDDFCFGRGRVPNFQSDSIPGKALINFVPFDQSVDVA